MREVKKNIKNEKISDKTMSLTVASCVVGLLITITMLAATTWAWFSASETSHKSSIVSASCTVSVELFDGTEKKSPISVHDGEYIYSLDADIDYTVTLAAVGNAQGGYARIYIGENNYLTCRIFTDEYVSATQDATDQNYVTFTLRSDTPVEIKVRTFWGSTSDTNVVITDGGVYSVIRNNIGGFVLEEK